MATNRIDAIHQIQTSETDTTLRLAPDGAGGVEWSTGGGGSSSIWRPVMAYDSDLDRYMVVTSDEGDAIMVDGG